MTALLPLPGRLSAASALCVACALTPALQAQPVLQARPMHPAHPAAAPPDDLLAVDDGTAETRIGPPEREIIAWMNVLSPPPGRCDYAVEAVRIRWPEADEDLMPGDSARAFVYADADGDGSPATGAVLLAEVPGVRVPDDPGAAFTEYALASPVTLTDCADVIVAFVNVGMRRDVFFNAPAAVDTTAPQGRSWVTLPADTMTLPPDLSQLRLLKVGDAAPVDGNFLIRAIARGVATSAESGTQAHFVMGAAAPNPARERTVLELTLAAPSLARVTLHALTGQRVRTVLDRSLAPGSHRLGVDTSGLAPGVYVLRAHVGERVETRRIVVLG